MPKCLVVFCKNRKGETEGVNFYRLTKERYEPWMKALGRNPAIDKVAVNNNVVCSEHFSEDSFLFMNGKRILKTLSVPTLKLHPEKFTIPSDQHLKQGINKSNEEVDLCFNKGLPPSDGTTLTNINKPSSSTQLESVEGLFQEGTALSHCSLSPSSQSSDQNMTSEHVTKTNRGKKRLGNTSTEDSEGLTGSPKRRRRDVRAIHNYSLSPRKLGKQLKDIKEEKKALQQTLKTSQARTKRLAEKVIHLKDIVNELKKTKLMSDDALTLLEKAYCNIPFELLKRLLGNLKRGKSGREKFPEELRSFALTLQFYSSKAYDYVRKTFHLALPSPSIIRTWMSAVNSEPGFSESAFKTLKIKVQQDNHDGIETVCALMLDEMALKKQIDFVANKTWGYVDVGTNIVDDEIKCATDALVLMVVSVNSHWKLSIAYFLINGLTGREKANIVNEALKMLHEVGVTIISVTCDGPSAHFTMANELGAKFDDISNIQPYFLHPSNEMKVFIIFDACHMIKLLRNNWAVLKCIFDGEGNIINFNLIQKLFELQESELLRFGTKLRKAHLEWQKQKMKVNLAAQTLSSSVADALEFLMTDIGHPDFQEAKGTIRFLRNADKLFDLCNSKNAFARGRKTPLKNNNEHYWRPILENLVEYLKNLKNRDGVPLYLTRHKTPIKGFIVTALSLLGIYDTYVREGKYLKYLLTYKLSQDHLELFFFNVRAKNGSNNNPTAFQFYNTFKRLILQHDLKLEGGNCIVQDATSILRLTNTLKQVDKRDTTIDDISVIKKYNLDEVFNKDVLEDHNYYSDMFSSLTPLTENVVSYIAGFVVKKLKVIVKCNRCLLSLESLSNFSMDDSSYRLYNRKNRGGLIKPSKDVVHVTKYVERQIRIMLHKTGNKMPTEKHFFSTFNHQMYIKLFQEQKCFQALHNHHLDYSMYTEDHVAVLIKLIIFHYSKIRFYSIAKRQTENERGELIRKTHSKLILFKHQ